MPELPDVEHERRFLAERATRRRIDRVVVTDDGILRDVAAEALDRALRGERFLEPDRQGKWLLAATTGPTVLLHFGMTGGLRWGDGWEDRHRHDRVIFELDRGELRYRNMRKLGGVWLAHDDAEVAAVLGDLGPDALGIDGPAFRERLASRRGRVKAVLMNQSVISGVGNILADEVLWQARLHPERRVSDLGDRDLDRLHDVLGRVLRISVERYDHLPRMTRWLSHVRGEPGAACPRCRTPLRRTVVAGRTTYFCPRCQGAEG